MDPICIPIPTELFAPAESFSFDGSYGLPVLKAGPDLYDFPVPLTWQVSITNTGDALLVTGTIEGNAKTTCARCLGSFEFPVTGEVEGYYLISREVEAPEDLEDDEFDYLPDDKVIDLEPLLQAALLVEFPLVPLCDEDCRGICVTCGEDLNEGACSCERDAEEAPKNPFSVLRDFPFEK